MCIYIYIIRVYSHTHTYTHIYIFIHAHRAYAHAFLTHFVQAYFMMKFALLRISAGIQGLQLRCGRNASALWYPLRQGPRGADSQFVGQFPIDNLPKK